MDSYTILLDMGADNTTLLVSNGQKIWIRNVPIGGNHFTRALTKEMKLTFAKAEHLKCNATKSPDPRAVFQALRPGLQRLRFRNSAIDRLFLERQSRGEDHQGGRAGQRIQARRFAEVPAAKPAVRGGADRIVQRDYARRVQGRRPVRGKHPQLPGLLRRRAAGAASRRGFARRCLPKEITTARTIARKKPWAVAAAAVLLASLALSATGFAHVYNSVSEQRFGDAEKKIGEVSKKAIDLKNEYRTEKGKNDGIEKGSSTLVGALIDGRNGSNCIRA